MPAAPHLPFVGVVTGGKSTERERSLLSGKAAYESLLRQGYRTVMLDTTAATFPVEVQQVDVALLAIAGQYAEDGKLQGFLETLGIPYTGSGVLASALGMDKTMAKTVVVAAGVPIVESGQIPPGAERCSAATATALIEAIGLPLIIKPTSEGGSIGMTVCRDADSLTAALAGIEGNGGWFAERFVPGIPVTCAVTDVDGCLMALPPLETIPTKAEFYDYASKRDASLHEYRCPAKMPKDMTAFIQESAKKAHQALGCSGYSRSDFIVSKDGEVIWLEVNTLPGLSHGGNLATMAGAAGIGYDQLIRMILATANVTGGYRP